MTARVLVTLVAVVVSVDRTSIEIDKGLTDGLLPGDRGEVFYELNVGGERRRVDVGPVEVVSVEASSATAGLFEVKNVRPGFKIEFEIDQERLSPENAVAAMREHLGAAAAVELAERYLEALRPATAPDDPAPSEAAPASTAPPEVLPHSQTMLRIATGHHAIGLDIGSARFYNESPRFEEALAEFWIDPAPVEPTGLEFALAEAHCRARGKRLPTELEWEVASGNPAFEVLERLEWTSSWYLAYPGNRHFEEEYGERFRVLRGSTDSDSFRPQARRYLGPAESSPNVGFRCASSAAASD